MSSIPDSKFNEIERIIDWYRSIILDAVEEEYGNTDEWIIVRSKLLRALGDRGLYGKIREALHFPEKGEGK